MFSGVFWGHYTHFCIGLRIVFFTEKGLLWAIARLDDMVGELRCYDEGESSHGATVSFP